MMEREVDGVPEKKNDGYGEKVYFFAAGNGLKNDLGRD